MGGLGEQLLGWRHEAELLKHSERIYQHPILNYASIRDSVNDEHLNRDELPCGRNSKPASKLRAACDALRHHTISLGKHLFYGEANIGERSQPICDVMFQGFRPTWRADLVIPESKLMRNAIFREEVISQCQLALVPEFFDEAAYYCLVSFNAHLLLINRGNLLRDDRRVLLRFHLEREPIHPSHPYTLAGRDAHLRTRAPQLASHEDLSLGSDRRHCSSR